jgi:hypothetical protein
MNLMSQQLETLMTCHAWQQQAMLTRWGRLSSDAFSSNSSKATKRR